MIEHGNVLLERLREALRLDMEQLFLCPDAELASGRVHCAATRAEVLIALELGRIASSLQLNGDLHEILHGVRIQLQRVAGVAEAFEAGGQLEHIAQALQRLQAESAERNDRLEQLQNRLDGWSSDNGSTLDVRAFDGDK